MFSIQLCSLSSLVIAAAEGAANVATPVPGASPAAAPDITAFVTLLAALSVATERLVETAKGISLFGDLFAEPKPGEVVDPTKDAKRQKLVQILAWFCGSITAGLSWPALQKFDWLRAIGGVDAWTTPKWYVLIVVLGLVLTGSSGTYNSLSTWLKNLSKQPLPPVTPPVPAAPPVRQ
jgi:hypothetical protein